MTAEEISARDEPSLSSGSAPDEHLLFVSAGRRVGRTTRWLVDLLPVDRYALRVERDGDSPRVLLQELVDVVARNAREGYEALENDPELWSTIDDLYHDRARRAEAADGRTAWDRLRDAAQRRPNNRREILRLVETTGETRDTDADSGEHRAAKDQADGDDD